METFQDFGETQVPERSAGSIITHAFEMYKGIFLYAIGAILLMIAISVIIQPVSGFDSDAVMEEMRSSPESFGENIWGIPGIKTYYGLSGLISILLMPLYVGIIYLANRYNLKQKLSFSDLFIGYRQNFLNIILYAVISSIIMTIAFAMCVLPGFFVLPFLLLGYPILLFENASFSEALSKAFEIGKKNYGTLLGASFLGILISICGIFLCGIGIIFTACFYLVVMYSAYCAYCGRPRAIEENMG